MANYFNYFTEIETRFQQRRGSILLLSTLDWALIDSWREAGVPLEAVLRGIDDAFDKYERRSQVARGRLRKVNGLAWCAQAVMQATEDMQQAVTGMLKAAPEPESTGFTAQRVRAFLQGNAAILCKTNEEALQDIGEHLCALSQSVGDTSSFEDAERFEAELSALEERMFAALTLSAGQEEMVALRAQAARELAHYRGKMTSVQLKQVADGFVHKRLMEQRGLPRLSLFYMSME